MNVTVDIKSLPTPLKMVGFRDVKKMVSEFMSEPFQLYCEI